MCSTAAALAVGTCFSLAACGDKAPNLTGTYNSSTYTFMTAYPGYTFKQLTTVVQNLNTSDDNTYMFTVTSKSLSGDLAFDPANNGTQATDGVNDRGQSVDIYYGTYTSTEEDGLLTVKLSAPTGYVTSASVNASGTGGGFFNTMNWTDDMKEASKDDTHTEGLTAEEYLATKTFKETEIVIDLKTYGFTFVQLSK